MYSVLMIGPDRSVHGGISGVVNMYYDAGFDKEIQLRYIGTMKEGSKLKKLLVAFGAYLRFILLLHKCDIVHVNVASDASFVRKEIFIRTAHKFGKKLVIHQHGGDFKNWYMSRSPKRQKEIRKTLDMGECLLALSPELSEFFGEILESQRIILFPNSIEIKEKNTEKDYSSHEMLFLGRICNTKGIRELFEIMPDVVNKYPDTILYLGGIFEDPGLEDEAKRLEPNVQFLGWLGSEEKEKYLQKCPIFILPTYFEGQPVSVIEAMAACSCIITCNVGGIPMMLDNNENGIMVEPQNAQMLRQAVLEILDDTERKKRLGQTAYDKAAHDYDISSSIKELLNIYGEIM